MMFSTTILQALCAISFCLQQGDAKALDTPTENYILVLAEPAVSVSDSAKPFSLADETLRVIRERSQDECIECVTWRKAGAIEAKTFPLFELFSSNPDDSDSFDGALWRNWKRTF